MVIVQIILYRIKKYIYAIPVQIELNLDYLNFCESLKSSKLLNINIDVLEQLLTVPRRKL